jgi:predicted DCC family thiol-disulfide oxidoreductase YuxK
MMQVQEADMNATPNPGASTTVYYNSACPVCDAGICALQQRLVGDPRVQWVDVHRQPDVLDALGLQLEDVRERLHVADGQGRMLVGAEALASAVQHLPRWGRLAAPLRWWGVRHLTRPLYNAFARWLYRWNRARGHW